MTEPTKKDRKPKPLKKRDQYRLPKRRESDLYEDEAPPERLERKDLEYLL